eukprot:PhF_6_TR33025/c0_g1_i2/m.48677
MEPISPQQHQSLPPPNIGSARRVPSSNSMGASPRLTELQIFLNAKSTHIRIPQREVLTVKKWYGVRITHQGSTVLEPEYISPEIVMNVAPGMDEFISRFSHTAMPVITHVVEGNQFFERPVVFEAQLWTKNEKMQTACIASRRLEIRKQQPPGVAKIQVTDNVSITFGLEMRTVEFDESHKVFSEVDADQARLLEVYNKDIQSLITDSELLAAQNRELKK